MGRSHLERRPYVGVQGALVAPSFCGNRPLYNSVPLRSIGRPLMQDLRAVQLASWFRFNQLVRHLAAMERARQAELTPTHS
jgi:hypothetical protein